MGFKSNSTGSITIDALSEDAASRLLATTSIGGIPVQAQLLGTYRAKTGSIRGISSPYSDEALLGYLRDQGVIRVCRRYRRITADMQEPTDKVVIHETTERPETVNLGFWCSKVRDFIEPPPRCFRCQRFGDIAKHCLRKVPRCS